MHEINESPREKSLNVKLRFLLILSFCSHYPMPKLTNLRSTMQFFAAGGQIKLLLSAMLPEIVSSDLYLLLLAKKNYSDRKMATAFIVVLSGIRTFFEEFHGISMKSP